MAAKGVLKINHRELLLSSRKKRTFFFLTLPHDLQDRIIDGFDANTLTLHQAVQLVQAEGVRLSFQAISGYYAAVRQRRDELLSKKARR